MLPNWLFWTSAYWMVIYIIFLGWYSREVRLGRKPRMNWLIALWTFVIVGFAPVIAVFFLLKKTKR